MKVYSMNNPFIITGKYIVGYDGVSWPLAFFVGKAAADNDYPNFLSTVYWNPIVEIEPGRESSGWL